MTDRNSPSIGKYVLTRKAVGCWFLLFWITLSLNAGTLALIGGEKVDYNPKSWSEEIVRWIVKNAEHGKILILSCKDETGYLARYFQWQGAAEAAHLTIPERYIADRAEMYNTIQSADGIVIVDGQMWEMTEKWKGTRTESAIRDLFAEGKVVAGIGEGAELLGEFVCDYRKNPLSPKNLLARPLPPDIPFSEDFLTLLPKTIIKSRSFRNGRLPYLLAELDQKRSVASNTVIAIGIDEKTALLIDDDNSATVLGEGSVQVIHATASTSSGLDHRLPPVLLNFSADFLTEGFVYDLNLRAVITAPPTALQIQAPAISDLFSTPLLAGNSLSTELAGPISITNLRHDSLALQRGLLKEIKGNFQVPHSIFVVDAFYDKEYYENQVGGLLWGLANHPGYNGFLMPADSKGEVLAAGTFAPCPVSDQEAIMVFDTRNVTYRDFSPWISDRENQGKRLSVSLVGLRIHQIATRWNFHIPTGRIIQIP